MCSSFLAFFDFANYLESNLVPPDLPSYRRKNSMHDVENFFWDKSYLYHSYANGIVPPCVPEVEMSIFLRHVIHRLLVGIIVVFIMRINF